MFCRGRQCPHIDLVGFNRPGTTLPWVSVLGSEPRNSGPHDAPTRSESTLVYLFSFLFHLVSHRLHSLRLPSLSLHQDCRFYSNRPPSERPARQLSLKIPIAPRKQSPSGWRRPQVSHWSDSDSGIPSPDQMGYCI